VVIVADDSGGSFAPRGTALHCVEPADAGRPRRGSPVVVRHSSGELVEIVLAETVGDGYRAYATKAPLTDATLVGVPIRRYS
jgi:hypothetical protein